MVKDTFEFVNEVQSLEINRGNILVSYDVTSLFTNVPLDETIQILADKAFHDDWFNKTHALNLSRDQLIELLTAATKNQPSFRSMEISMSKPMASQWDLILVLCSPMSLCAPLKIN